MEYVKIAPKTGVGVVPLSDGYEVPRTEGGGAAWVFFFVGDAISVEAQWAENGRRCLELSRTLASIQSEAMGERGLGDEQARSHNKTVEWAPRQKVFGSTLDTEVITILLPARKAADPCERLTEWPATCRMATVKEVGVGASG